MLKKFIFYSFTSVIFCSGAFDNGSATGKGRFQLDITWNPFDKIEFGQSYALINYGITNRIDLHGYISKHYGNYYTAYGGLFYQFHKSKKVDLATAVGFRKKIGEELTHIFFPQLLYTFEINEKFKIGGSIVSVVDKHSKVRYGETIDIGLFYRLKYESNLIESISIGLSAFHPTTWKPNQFFLPTYSIDIKFN